MSLLHYFNENLNGFSAILSHYYNKNTVMAKHICSDCKYLSS